MEKKKALQPELIKVVSSKKRNLEVDYNYNTCSVTIGVEFDFNGIDLNEGEVRRLQKALAKFIEVRDALRGGI